MEAEVLFTLSTSQCTNLPSCAPPCNPGCSQPTVEPHAYLLFCLWGGRVIGARHCLYSSGKLILCAFVHRRVCQCQCTKSIGECVSASALRSWCYPLECACIVYAQMNSFHARHCGVIPWNVHVLCMLIRIYSTLGIVHFKFKGKTIHMHSISMLDEVGMCAASARACKLSTACVRAH